MVFDNGSDDFIDEVVELDEEVAILDGDTGRAMLDAELTGGDPLAAAMEAEVIGGIHSRRRPRGGGFSPFGY